MFEPIPKPEKRGPKPPKPLQRKTPLRSFKVDEDGKPIFPKNRFTSYQMERRTEFVRDQESGLLVVANRSEVVSSVRMSAIKKNSAIKPKFDDLWAVTRRTWYELNPPDIGDDYYQCRLCPYSVHKDETTLDHIQPKGSHPRLKYTLSNLQPAHGECNGRKGSMSMESYERTYGVGGRSLAFQTGL